MKIDPAELETLRALLSHPMTAKFREERAAALTAEPQVTTPQPDSRPAGGLEVDPFRALGTGPAPDLIRLRIEGTPPPRRRFLKAFWAWIERLARR